MGQGLEDIPSRLARRTISSKLESISREIVRNRLLRSDVLKFMVDGDGTSWHIYIHYNNFIKVAESEICISDSIGRKHLHSRGDVTRC